MAIKEFVEEQASANTAVCERLASLYKTRDKFIILAKNGAPMQGALDELTHRINYLEVTFSTQNKSLEAKPQKDLLPKQKIVEDKNKLANLYKTLEKFKILAERGAPIQMAQEALTKRINYLESTFNYQNGTCAAKIQSNSLPEQRKPEKFVLNTNHPPKRETDNRFKIIAQANEKQDSIPSDKSYSNKDLSEHLQKRRALNRRAVKRSQEVKRNSKPEQKRPLQQYSTDIDEKFTAIHEEYREAIYNYVYRTMGNPEDAADLTQETFVRAYQALSRYNDEGKIKPWLYRIATNACLDELRRRKVIRWQPWDTYMSVFHPKQIARDNPEQDAVDKENAEIVSEVMDKIPPRYRLCLLLREYEELSCEEIAQIMGTTRGAVKSLLFRAREEFREEYIEFDNPKPKKTYSNRVRELVKV